MRAALVDGGYSSVSIEGLATSAGVSKQTIYRWWPSKAAILGEALLDGTLPGADVALPMTEDLEADLRAFFSTQSRGSGETVALARALIAVTATDPELGAALNERLAAPIRAWVTERIARGVEAGDVRADVDAGVVAEQLIAFGSYAALVGRPWGDARVDAVVDVLVRGIAAARSGRS